MLSPLPRQPGSNQPGDQPDIQQSPQDWTPLQELLDFLGKGDRPITVSLGVMSMSGEGAQESARIVLQAISRASVRAIIQGWDEALHGVDLPSQIYHAGPLPHSWLFDQVDTIVHHGGFGTTASALRAGVPGIVIPHAIDQFYWGQRVNELGAGPRPISRDKMNVRKLSDAILTCKNNLGMRQKARQIGEDIRLDEDGVAIAVRKIENLF